MINGNKHMETYDKRVSIHEINTKTAFLMHMMHAWQALF